MGKNVHEDKLELADFDISFLTNQYVMNSQSFNLKLAINGKECLFSGIARILGACSCICWPLMLML